jgi:kynurenine formamidase
MLDCIQPQLTSMLIGVTTTPEVRAQFDAEVTFRNGGGLEAHGFRLDIVSAQTTDDALAEAFVRELGLVMVDEVRISNRTLVHEPHKGLRATAAERPPKRASRYVELSHRIRHGMITYPGLPGPEITDHLTREASRARYAPGTEFHIGRISMVANTGTYLDTPSHRFSDGADLAGVPLSRLCDVDGLVVRLAGDDIRAIDRQVLLPFDVRGRAVLLHTGWDRLWGTERYGSGHPYVTADGADWLVEAGAALVGIDSVNIDDAEDGNRPAHTALLRAGIPIVEHLCGLDELPPEGFRFFATPPLIVGMGTFPVRACAIVDR